MSPASCLPPFSLLWICPVFCHVPSALWGVCSPCRCSLTGGLWFARLGNSRRKILTCLPLGVIPCTLLAMPSSDYASVDQCIQAGLGWFPMSLYWWSCGKHRKWEASWGKQVVCLGLYHVLDSFLSLSASCSRQGEFCSTTILYLSWTHCQQTPDFWTKSPKSWTEPTLLS